jgi:hypothetical protein
MCVSKPRKEDRPAGIAANLTIININYVLAGSPKETIELRRFVIRTLAFLAMFSRS